MFVLVILFSIYIFFKTLSYGIFEIKKNSNTIGGITVIVVAIISLIYPNIMVYIRGIY